MANDITDVIYVTLELLLVVIEFSRVLHCLLFIFTCGTLDLFLTFILVHMYERTLYIPLSQSIHFRVISIVRFVVDTMFNWFKNLIVCYWVVVIILVVNFFLSKYERLGDSHVAIVVLNIIVLTVGFKMHLPFNLLDWVVYCIQVGGWVSFI